MSVAKHRFMLVLFNPTNISIGPLTRAFRPRWLCEINQQPPRNICRIRFTNPLQRKLSRPVLSRFHFGPPSLLGGISGVCSPDNAACLFISYADIIGDSGADSPNCNLFKVGQLNPNSFAMGALLVISRFSVSPGPSRASSSRWLNPESTSPEISS